MSNLFVAEFKRGRAKLAKAELLKETDKTYLINRAEKLLGDFYYLPDRLLKSKYHCFSSGEEALTFLLERAEQWLARCQEQLDQASEKRDTVKSLLAYTITKPEGSEND